MVIIPAYNEEGNVAGVIKSIKEHVPSIDIVVINDGSADKTARVAKNEGATVINLPFNMGYGTALQTGYKYALEKGYDYVVQLDADGQHDPRYINKLLRKVETERVDVVIGSRFLDSELYKAFPLRRLGIFLFGSVASLIIRQRVTDATSGYQAINKQVLNFYASDIYPYDYPDANVIIMLYFAGFKIKELPVVMYPSKTGKSMHAGLKPLYYMFKMSLSILMTLLREKPHKRRS